MAFDVNDRLTWDWAYEDEGEFPAELGDYRLHMRDPSSYFQMKDGIPYAAQCPPSQVFNPMASPGPVCDYPQNAPETMIYDWAVSKGLVNDQR